ncbi:MAG: aminotransferase class I/II-fold pyridoxal phosphate-dependent enzyme [Blautia sp.]
MSLLEISHLTTKFETQQGTVSAVRDVSYHLEEGEVLGIVGESGSGKIVGMIFQDPMTFLNPILKIGIQMTEGIRKHQNCSKKEAEAKAIELMRQVGIPSPEKRLDQYPFEFSGGMRQRIIIATALACDPKLIIADEPTTALDVTVQAQILELLKKLTKEKGTSVIMITHDLGVVASMCDRIAIMYAGQIVEEGTVDEIFYEPHHPYTKGLLNSINNSAKDNDEPLVPIPGTPPDLLKLPKGCAFMSRCPYTMKICEVQASPVTTYSETHCCRCWLECMDETKITVSGEEAALEDSMAGSHFYPDFAAVLLKQKVAEQYGLKAENVLTGAGSSAMIDMIGLTFLDEGDEVLFSAPTYGAFADMAYLNGGVPVSVPVTEEQKFNLPAMKEKIGEKTKIVVICNPNNPTGTYVPIGELEAFADTLPEDVLLVMDEAYMEFATEPDCCSMVDYMKAHPEKPILVLRTFSKYYAMAGLRVGYALGSEELIGIMRKCSASWNLNVCAQKAAVAGLADQEYYQEQKAKIVEGREYLEKEMAALGCRVYPSQSNFIYFDTGKDPAWIQEQLMEKGIRIGAFEMSRVSVGTMEECKLYIKALKEILEAAE